VARNKTQPKIEKFLSDLTQLCRKHNMIIDANGGGYQGDGKGRTARFSEGCPLVLFTKSGINYRKIGYLWYSFLGDGENITFNFEPKAGTPYTDITFDEDPFPDPDPEEDAPEQNTTIQKSSDAAPSTLAEALKKAREWDKENK